MRTFEIALLIVDVVGFLTLVIPLPQNLHWLRYCAPASLVIAGVHAVVEGPRLEILPAYLMAILIFTVWLLQNVHPAGIFAGHRWISRVGIGLGVLGLLTSYAIPAAIPVFHFPQPGGKYGIGTLTYHWVDENRPEIFTTNPNDHRELLVQIWYPAEKDSKAKKAPYIPDADVLAAEFARVQGRQEIKPLLDNLKYIQSNAVEGAPVATDESRFPVLIFQEGLTGFRQMNTYQVEALVSQGYIVAAIDEPYVSPVVVFPDGHQVPGMVGTEIKPLVRQSYLPYDQPPALNGQVLENGIIPYLVQDTSFTLDQLAALNQSDPNGILTGRLDLDRAGVFGFSLGGIVAGDACGTDARLQACIIMDAPMTTITVKEGLSKPVMWITRDAAYMRLEREKSGGWSEEEISAHLDSMRAVYNNLQADGYFVQIPNTFHSNFCDISTWSPLYRMLGLTGPINPRRAHDIINAYSAAFFDRTLKGDSPTLLNGPSTQFPEVVFESHQP